MANTFAALKKTRETDLERLTKEVQKFSTKMDRKEDDRFWYPAVDKGGNGYAVIRFLPAAQNEEVPFVRIWNHGFQGPGGWYIENSLTTLGSKDPVSELNTKLWNSTTDDESPARKQARKQKRKLAFISNILVIKDSATPTNEGKVFLYRYGKKIWNKIDSVMAPEFEDETPINPFDAWVGANFKLKVRTVEGYRNYDKSEFDKPSAISENDEEIEKLWKTTYSLQAFIAPDQFKSYQELKKRLDKVLLSETVTREDTEELVEKIFPTASKEKTAPEPKLKSAAGEANDDLDFFRKLAENDE